MNPWQSVWTNSQRRLAYAGFVCALALETWAAFQSLPPTEEIYWVGALWALSLLPIGWALVASLVCALVLWPPLLSHFVRQSKLPQFFRGALIGTGILIASAVLAHFGYLAF